MFGPSDDSNDDRAEQKHHEQNQPSPGRRQMQIGQAHHLLHPCASPVARWQQASLSHQAIWWHGDGHPAFNWNGSQPSELGKGGEAIGHLKAIWEERAT
jgi:hypothetical protein